MISIIFSTTIPPYPVIPIMISINTFVTYELPVVEGFLGFEFSIFKIWRCGGFGRYSPPYTTVFLKICVWKFRNFCINNNNMISYQHLIFLLGLEMVALRFLVAILIVLFLCLTSAEG